MVELFVFVFAAVGCLAGAVGVVANRNPVHAALSLVGTLFSIAVLFIAQEANFLAAVQVIVYAGAIVVLFLFVIMLLGVDRAEDLSIEPLGGGQRIAAVILGLAIFFLPVAAIASTGGETTGAPAAAGAPNALEDGVADIEQLGQSLFTDYLFAFEITSVLLVIAVVGAVVLSRKVRRADLVDDPLVEAHEAEQAARAAEAEAKAQDAAEAGATTDATESDADAEVDA